jgi:hypothetical protein
MGMAMASTSLCVTSKGPAPFVSPAGTVAVTS